MANPFAHGIFGHFDADGGAFTRDQQYFCGTVPKSFSRVGPLRLKEAGARPRSLFEQITASARYHGGEQHSVLEHKLKGPPQMHMSGWIREQPASMATRQGPELNLKNLPSATRRALL
jgi:hypothetical protein